MTERSNASSAKEPTLAADTGNSEAHIQELANHEAARSLTEVIVFLFLIVPSMVLSFFVVKKGGMGFVLVAVATILRDLALVSLILYFIWRNGESVRRIGWTLKNLRKDVMLGIGLFIPFFFGAALLDGVLLSMGFSKPSTPMPSFLETSGVAQSVLAFFLVVIVALSEETIFRGYLILRFEPVFASSIKAALLSAVVFSLGHGYEGSAGVVTVGVMGFIFALVYLWRQSLVTPIVMHFLQDFITIVLVPLLAGK